MSVRTVRMLVRLVDFEIADRIAEAVRVLGHRRGLGGDIHPKRPGSADCAVPGRGVKMEQTMVCEPDFVAIAIGARMMNPIADRAAARIGRGVARSGKTRQADRTRAWVK